MKKQDEHKQENFESQWAKAFDNASLKPSDNLWDKIDGQINGESKKRVFYFFPNTGYAATAAASIVCLLGLSIFIQLRDSKPITKTEYAYTPESITTEKETVEELSTTSESKIHISSAKGDNDIPPTDKDNTLLASHNSGIPQKAMPIILPKHDDEDMIANVQSVASVLSVSSISSKQNDLALTLIDNKKLLDSNTNIPDFTPPTIRTKYDDWAVLLAIEEEQKESQSRPIIASAFVSPTLNFPDLSISGASQDGMVYSVAPSYYDVINEGSDYTPDVEMGDSPSQTPELPSKEDLKSVSLADEQNYTLSNSYSFGVRIGKRVKNKWVIQSGLDYSKYQYTAESNYLIKSIIGGKTIRNSTETFQRATNNKLESVDNYNKQHDFDILSIPIEAGYILLDKKVKITLTAGLSTNLLLNHEFSTSIITDDDKNLYTGEFNPIYIGSQIGGEISYAILDNISLFGTPNYKMGLTSFSKSDILLGEYPNDFGMLFGVKAIF